MKLSDTMNLSFAELVNIVDECNVHEPPFLLLAESGHDYDVATEGYTLLCDYLLECTRKGDITWAIRSDKSLLMGYIDHCTILILARTSGSYGWASTIPRLFTLDVGNDIAHTFSITFSESRALGGGLARRTPLVELYDIITEGKVRERPPKHVCGLSGYDPMRDEICPACERRGRIRKEKAQSNC
jgi:hypothetical protein